MAESRMTDAEVKRAQAAAGRSMAAVEEDCSRSWPECPRRDQVLCDCRLRAVRAVNAVKRVLDHG